MGYQITNSVSSIKFIGDNGEFTLLKETVHEISVLHDSIIKISTGDCTSGIFIRHQDIFDPVTDNAFILVDLLNTVLSGGDIPPSQGR